MGFGAFKRHRRKMASPPEHLQRVEHTIETFSLTKGVFKSK